MIRPVPRPLKKSLFQFLQYSQYLICMFFGLKLRIKGLNNFSRFIGKIGTQCGSNPKKFVGITSCFLTLFPSLLTEVKLSLCFSANAFLLLIE